MNGGATKAQVEHVHARIDLRAPIDHATVDLTGPDQSASNWMTDALEPAGATSIIAPDLAPMVAAPPRVDLSESLAAAASKSHDDSSDYGDRRKTDRRVGDRRHDAAWVLVVAIRSITAVLLVVFIPAWITGAVAIPLSSAIAWHLVRDDSRFMPVLQLLRELLAPPA